MIGKWSRLWAGLTGATHDVLVTSELLDADGAARMKFVCAYADLCAHTELAAVRELGRGVGKNDRAIDLAQKFFRDIGIGRHDRICMPRSVSLDVRNSFVDAIDDFRRNDC